jgi:hypothetical protein
MRDFCARLSDEAVARLAAPYLTGGWDSGKKEQSNPWSVVDRLPIWALIDILAPEEEDSWTTWRSKLYEPIREAIETGATRAADVCAKALGPEVWTAIRRMR